MKRKMILVLLVVVVWSGSALAESYGGADGVRGGAAELFLDANRAFDGGDYAGAVELYEDIAGMGKATGDVYYNLGNAYLEQGELGLAILNYERAKKLMPRDLDLRFNLGFAREKAAGGIEGAADPLFFWLGNFTDRELLGVFALFNILFFVVLSVRLFRRHEWSYYLAIVLLAAWIVSGLGWGVSSYRDVTDSRAVIIPGTVKVLAGPDVADTPLFELHSGSIVGFERAEDGWCLVNIDESRRGWLPCESVKKIKNAPKMSVE